MLALPLRRDFDAKSCRLAVRRSGDAVQPRRLVLIATIYSGASRDEAAALVVSRFRLSVAGSRSSTPTVPGA